MPVPRRLTPVCVTALLLSCASAFGQRWSPDGSWVAFVQKVDASNERAEARLEWLVGKTKLNAGVPIGLDSRSENVERLWAIHVPGEETALLEQAVGQLTEPSWSKNGTALAFGRLLGGEGGKPRPRFEIVYQESLDRKRVVQAWTWSDKLPRLEPTTRRDVALSPDGVWVVAPMLSPAGLVVLRLDNGQALKQIPGASRPAWSPDARYLSYVQGDPSQAVFLLDPRTGESSRVADLSSSPGVPAPRWSLDSQTIFFLDRDASMPPGKRLRIGRRRFDPSGQKFVEEAAIIVPQSTQVDGPALNGGSFGLDFDEANLFLSEHQTGQPAVITWLRTDRGDVLKRFNPFQSAVPLLDLAVSPRPNSRQVVLRLGAREELSPVALTEPEAENLIPLMPDESSRATWLGITLDAIGEILESERNPTSQIDWRDNWPTRLPLPGDYEEGHPAQMRLQSLARLGQDLLRRSVPESPGSIARAGNDAWAELIFAYLQGKYQDALARLDALETTTKDSGTRMRLLGLRAQLAIGLGQRDVATGILDGIGEIAANRGLTLLTLPTGQVLLLDDREPAVPWFDSLQKCLHESSNERAKREGQFMQSTDGLPFDPPLGGEGLLEPVIEPGPPNIVPAPPRPGPRPTPARPEL